MRKVFFSFLVCCLPLPVLADPCPALHALIKASSTDFAQGAPDDPFASAAGCGLSQNQNGSKTYLCHWEYGYRADAAFAKFDALDADIRACLTEATALPSDLSVNHPDSYDLKRYQTGQIVISAALKDKAALAQSLVFLRIDRVAN